MTPDDGHDEPDELAHCERVADAIPGVGSWETRIAIRTAIHEQRASARAETAAEVERLRGQAADLKAALMLVQDIAEGGWVEGTADAIIVECVRALEASK